MSLPDNRTRIPFGTTHCRLLSVESGARKGKLSFLGMLPAPPERRCCMDVIFPSCAGLDAHKRSVTACRIPPDPRGQQVDGVIEVKEFNTLTHDLLAPSDWLAALGMTHVAMESTGEYWKPIFNPMEETCQVFTVNASHVKRVPGRKIDKADARWLAQLMR